MRVTHKSSRGVSLVEAMVALAVMAFGMLAVVGVQSTLRLNADVAKQRSEATRLGQEKLDDLRSFTAIDGAGGYSERVADSGPTAFTDLVTNTTYSVQSKVVTYTDPPARALRVTVSWTDRAGGPQEVVLASAIAAAAPGLSGTLAVRPGIAAAAPVRRPFKRHPTIPVQARDFGTSSAFVLPGLTWISIVFNNATGVITGVCDFNTATNSTIAPSDIALCSNNTVGQLLSGFVRFQRRTDGPELTAADAENPIGPTMDLTMVVTLSSTGHPHSPFCGDDTSVLSEGNGQIFATYYCVVYSNNSGVWSGINNLLPRFNNLSGDWFISGDSSGGPGADSLYRVCRYTSAADDSQPVPNQDHPRNYTDVSGNLTNQNFMVISSRKHCPTDVAADPSAGDFVNSNTLQHQPAP
jgi:Tfp pilus assembly protein PilV